MVREFAATLVVLIGLCGTGSALAAEPAAAVQDTKEMLVANVREFGAKGDGKTDDTAAIEKAWAFVMDTHKPQYNGGTNTMLYFPPGVYRYTGKGLESGANGSQCWQVKGDGFDCARIEIESDVYFITCSFVRSNVIEGLTFRGGKGVFKSTHTGNMVGNKHIFRDCYFLNYTECAIGNNANDSPCLTVYDCIFHCRDKAEAIGIAWGGLIDEMHIERCDFRQNAYHIKLGDGMGGNGQIGPRNLFLSWGGTKTKADIWIVPQAAHIAGTNSGQGTLIVENKFGNENSDQCQRVLIAAEDAGSGRDRLSRKPSTEVCDEFTMLTGLRLRDNSFYGSQGGVGGKIGPGMRNGIVYSRVPYTAVIFDHNNLSGAPHPYLIEFDSRIKRLPDRTPGNCTYIYSQERDNVERDLFPTELCNLPGYGIAVDPYSNFAGAGEVPDVYQQSGDPSYTPLVALMGKDMPVSGKAAIVPVNDPRGGKTAVTVKLEDSSSGLDIRLDEARHLSEGRVAFIDVELKAAESGSLDNVHVMVLNKKVTKAVDVADAVNFLGDKVLFNQRAFSRTVKLQPYWQRITIPFVLRDTRDGEFHLVIRPYGYGAKEFIKGEKDGFVCGNVRVYHAKSPDNGERRGVRMVNDQDLTLCPGVDPEQIIYEGNLTVERTVDFSLPTPATRPLPGNKFRISRTASGDSPLKIKGVTDLAANEWCEIVYTGEKFCLVAKGKL